MKSDPVSPSEAQPLEAQYLGIDFGTSGARAIAIDANQQIRTEVHLPFPVQAQVSLAELWRETLFQLLGAIPWRDRQQIQAIAINGTSSTVLLCDAQGKVLGEPMLYNEDRAAFALQRVRAIAPPNHTVISATSSLTKLMAWVEQRDFTAVNQPIYFLHQADWLGALLHGQLGITDYHNVLKLGYDVGALCYPDWLQSLTIPFQLPQVVAPGTAIAPILPHLSETFGFPVTCEICAGTTDSIAAFLASQVQQAGEAVTSLGSTLVLKLLSQTRVDDGRSGIYSHRWGDRWLVGGASNTGGAVLKQFFSSEELETLSAQIDPQQDSGLDYYPLLKPGERFPINDPSLAPRLMPRPDRPVDFLQGLLEGLARFVALGYQRLLELGATRLSQVYTAGGGARNGVWGEMRSRYLGVPVLGAQQTEAAFGSALLAMKRGL
ncbi:MAG: FGGY-family carbohydrate kinase [Oculatellaceae cyanobacterium Prado106]|nr:FGGY-family carbohydrate kinase [Oculatellaceae cyanobacterium Prado106]